MSKRKSCFINKEVTMTSEELERAIVTEKLEADKYMHPEDGAVVCAYKALPHLL